ncbi:hypothetical protein GGI00_000622, partial [Coemansia sp. RSA 2681]
SPSAAAPRSNSLTLASVSSLLRAATTANANASAASAIIAGRRASARAQPAAPILEVAETSPNGDHHHRHRHHHRLLAQQPLLSNHTRSASVASSSSSSAASSDALASDSSANVNVEYLRNVLFRFFNDKDRRTQLVPVLSMLLRCKTDEIKHIQLLLQK